MLTDISIKLSKRINVHPNTPSAKVTHPRNLSSLLTGKIFTATINSFIEIPAGKK